MGMSGVAGVTVVLLRWRRSSEDKLSSAMAPAALGAGMAAAAGEEEGRGNEKRSAEGVGRALAVLKPRSGLALLRGVGHWRRAASHDIHVAALPWRRSATEWRRQLIRLSQAEPDSAYCNDENFVTNGFQ